MKFLNAKYTIVAMAFMMSLIMSGVISLAFALMDDGISLHSFALWPEAWLRGWIVALPVAVVVMPFVRKIVSKVTI